MTDQSSVERVAEHIGENLPADLMGRLGEATKVLEEATEAYKREGNEIAAKARDDAARTLTEIKAQVDADNARAEAERDAEIDKLIADSKGTRAPSKAWLMAGGGAGSSQTYEPGDFIYNLYMSKSNDFTLSQRAKAEQALIDMGAVWGDPLGTSIGEVQAEGGYFTPAKAQAYYEERAKATLGTTSTTGAVLFPGATVGALVKPPRAVTAAEGLVTSRVMTTYGAVMPVRAASPSRAVIAAWGETKENRNLTYQGYTATPYTMALIYDLAKQYMRFSRGAAEADVRGELATAFALGRSYYILQGAGTTEPFGIQTVLATTGSTYTTSHTAAATLAGSTAKAIAKASGDLGTRNWSPEAALLGVAAYWTMVSEGTDSAGFFFAPSGGPTDIRPGTLVSPFGVPVYPETQLAGTNDLLVGAWSAIELYRGQDYRVDVSDEAGDRWDKNLVGFRGEEEIGLDARPAVLAGAFQFVAAVATS